MVGERCGQADARMGEMKTHDVEQGITAAEHVANEVRQGRRRRANLAVSGDPPQVIDMCVQAVRQREGLGWHMGHDVVIVDVAKASLLEHRIEPAREHAVADER